MVELARVRRSADGNPAHPRQSVERAGRHSVQKIHLYQKQCGLSGRIRRRKEESGELPAEEWLNVDEIKRGVRPGIDELVLLITPHTESYVERKGCISLHTDVEFLNEFIAVVQGFPKYTKDYEGNFDWLKYGSAEPLETRGETPIDSWTADQKKMGLESTPAQEGGTAYCYGKTATSNSATTPDTEPTC